MNPQENPPLSPAEFAARLDRAMQRHAATQPAYWPVADDAAQPGTVTDAERLLHAERMVDLLRAKLVTAREELESLKRHEWFVGKAAESRAARTVAELTELLVAASSEWDDNTGDDETSRPYLEHLAKAIESWRPVPAEAAEPEGQNR